MSGMIFDGEDWGDVTRQDLSRQDFAADGETISEAVRILTTATERDIEIFKAAQGLRTGV